LLTREVALKPCHFLQGDPEVAAAITLDGDGLDLSLNRTGEAELEVVPMRSLPPPSLGGGGRTGFSPRYFYPVCVNVNDGYFVRFLKPGRLSFP
jgi:hypothetical protein